MGVGAGRAQGGEGVEDVNREREEGVPLEFHVLAIVLCHNSMILYFQTA